MRHSLISLSITIILSLTGCSRDNSAEKASPVRIHRLDLALESGNPADIDSMRAAALTLFNVIGAGDLTPESLETYRSGDAVNFYAPDISTRLPSLDSIEQAVGKIYDRMNRLLPDAPRHDLYAVILPYNQSVFIMDSMMFIGLNHYLGADYQPYTHFPSYRRSLKTPARLPVDIAEASVATAYPFNPQSAYPTVLNRILYEGAIIESIMQLTGVDEATALGYTPAQWQWMKENEARAWEKLISHQLLYNTDPANIRSLVDPAPFTSVLNPEAPGRAGRYIGHRILSFYIRNNPDITLDELLSPDFYMSSETLSKAVYHP